jgi:hypothetical protein
MRRLIMLICVGLVTILVSVGRLPRSGHERLSQALNAHAGYAKTGLRLFP